jgi:hypothetical protein
MRRINLSTVFVGLIAAGGYLILCGLLLLSNTTGG